MTWCWVATTTSECFSSRAVPSERCAPSFSPSPSPLRSHLTNPPAAPPPPLNASRPSYVVKQHGPHGVWIVKSGTDFRALTELRISFPETPAPYARGSVAVAWKKHDIVAGLPEDPAMKAILDEYLLSREKQMAAEMGYVDCELDARFATVRTKESNAGNLVADILVQAHHHKGAECCIINGGLLRADRVQGPGKYLVKDLVDILPMSTISVLLGVPGKLFGSILENSVCVALILGRGAVRR